MRKLKRILYPLALLMLFLAYQASITMFTHAHIVNGVMIVHSHPTTDQHHTHTAGQVITIAHLSQVLTIEPETGIEVPVFRPMLYALTGPVSLVYVQAPHTHCVQLRAPPFYG